MRAPLYESPGGVVPAIVTHHGAVGDDEVRITARGTAGATVTCRGPVWRNPRRATSSRRCYLRLPLVPGAYGVRATVTRIRPRGPAIVHHGGSARPVHARGFASARAMSIAEIERIERCHNTTPHVWLTFDDRGSARAVRTIMRTLRRNDARGRFFFTGQWMAANAALVRELRRGGHVIANHTYSHAPLSLTPWRVAMGEIARGTTAGGTPLLRPPYGAGALTTRLRGLARARGHLLCRWTVDTWDWQGPSAARMAERVRLGDETTPPVEAGGVILMHG